MVVFFLRSWKTRKHTFNCHMYDIRYFWLADRHEDDFNAWDWLQTKWCARRTHRQTDFESAEYSIETSLDCLTKVKLSREWFWFLRKGTIDSVGHCNQFPKQSFFLYPICLWSGLPSGPWCSPTDSRVRGPYEQIWTFFCLFVHVRHLWPPQLFGSHSNRQRILKIKLAD